jgi:non-ribosomal peptide synthetase component F
LRLLSEAQRKDLSALVRLVADEGIERIFLPCVALQAFAEAACVSQKRLESLRVVISSGEQLRVTPEIRRLCSANQCLVLENQYGPTETHVAASYTMSGSPEDFPMLPPIGTAIDGATISVLGADLRPVPTGIKGEIYLGGRCLALGYEARPDLTAERFVTIGEHGERMYRTGDLGVQVPSGDVLYLGRADTQVKVRGFRIECAEVELALMRLNPKAIQAVAVVARNLDSLDSIWWPTSSGTGKRRISPRSGGACGGAPEYMIDASTFRRTSAHAERQARRQGLRSCHCPPSLRHRRRSAGNACEQAVADVMAEFAGSASFAADTNFFDAGGTSIGAMRVVMAISRTWGVEIPLDAFVTAATPAHIASLVAAGGPARRFDPVVALRPRAIVHRCSRLPSAGMSCAISISQPPSGRSAGLCVAGGRCRTWSDATPHDERPGRVLYRGDS